MIEFRKRGGGEERRGGKKGELLNFRQVKFKDGRGGEGNLRWKTKKVSHTSNEAINAI